MRLGQHGGKVISGSGGRESLRNVKLAYSCSEGE